MTMYENNFIIRRRKEEEARRYSAADAEPRDFAVLATFHATFLAEK